MKPGVRAAAIFVVVAAGLVSCGSSGELSLTSEPATRIEVTSESGFIRVTGDDGAAEITIDTVYRWDVEAPEIKTEHDGEVVRVFHECAEDDSGCAVDYTIEVPESIDVVVSTASGDVSVAAVTGTATVTTASGDVTVSGIGGTLEVSTASGGILGVNLESPTGTVVSASGRIDVSWDEPVNDLTVESASSDITVQAPGEPYNITATSTSGDVDVRVETDDADAKTISITTESGNIRVYPG